MQLTRTVFLCSPRGPVKECPVIPDKAPLDEYYYVYVLKLEGNRFYIGRSGTPEKRLWYLFEQHNSAPQFVQYYRPVQVTEDFIVFDYHAAEQFKNDLTAYYTRLYGAAIVRGGDYVPAFPPQSWIDDMQKRSENATMNYWYISSNTQLTIDSRYLYA